jgi:hypothetical protein
LDVLTCIGNTAYSVCGTVGGTCYCWQYEGSGGTMANLPGTLQAVSASNCSATCGSSSDPKWN